MKLKEVDWDGTMGFIEVEYPDELVAEFVNWIRNTKQWKAGKDHATNAIYAQWLKLERNLTDHKNEQATSDRCKATTAAGAPCKGKATSNGLCMAHTKAAA